MNDQIERLADRLMAEGHYDNQADARQAALDILLAALHRNDPAPTQRPNVEHGENQDLESDAETAHAEDGVAG